MYDSIQRNDAYCTNTGKNSSCYNKVVLLLTLNNIFTLFLENYEIQSILGISQNWRPINSYYW